MTTITQMKWFWAWDDEKEEAWLRSMAQQGWHLMRVDFIAKYIFEQGEQRDDVYRLDFFTDNKNKADYLQLFQDAGWEYVGAFGSWQYFRKPVAGGELPEIFSDNESKIRKYQRVIGGLLIIFPILIISLSNSGRSEYPLMQAFSQFIALLLILFSYAEVRLFMRINQLRKRF